LAEAAGEISWPRATELKAAAHAIRSSTRSATMGFGMS